MNTLSYSFFSEHHENRSVKNNFLDIRLKSDLLAKNLLFVGYSFRDPNIQCLFAELHTVFGGKLPPAYMIALNYIKALPEITKDKEGKLILLPYESSALMGSLSTIKEIFKMSFQKRIVYSLTSISDALIIGAVITFIIS